jgi:hypothetical protein
MKKTPIHALTITIVILVFAWLMIERAQAEGIFDGPGIFDTEPTKSDFNSFYKDDGSLVNVYGAEESGIVVKDGEVEYYVVPKDDGSPTFVYDNELIICTNTGCY